MLLIELVDFMVTGIKTYFAIVSYELNTFPRINW